MDLFEDSAEPPVTDPKLINRAKPKDKKALGLGALLAAGAAAGYIMFSKSGKLLLKMMQKPRQ